MTRDVILWVLADELRADALGCYGTPDPAIRTPHIDRLARSGVIFDAAYTASPVCVPARVSMATGLRPDQSGVWGNEAYVAGYPLPADLLTFTEVLADAGWRTASYGKEHVPPAIRPWQVHDPTGSSMQELMQGADPDSMVKTPGVGFTVAGTWPATHPYPPEAITDSVIAEIRDATGPLLVRASYLQPHTPVIVPEPWASLYQDVPFEDAPHVAPVASDFERRFAEVNRGSEMDPDDFRRAQVAYFGAVAWLDDQVGRLMAAIDAVEDLGRVTVLLTTDHGAHLGEDGSYGKHTFAPFSARIPLIVAGSAIGASGIRRSDLASNLDIGRTLLAIAQVPPPARIGGRDLFADAAPEHLVSGIGYGALASRAFPNLAMGTGSGESGWPQRVCVRTDQYRLDLTTRWNGEETTADPYFVDRRRDPGERQNRSGDPAYQIVEEELTAIARTVMAHAVIPPDPQVFDRFTAPGARKK